MISVESCLKWNGEAWHQSELKLLYIGLKGAGQKYTPCQIQMVTAWFLHAFPDLFNPSLYVCFLRTESDSSIMHLPSLCAETILAQIFRQVIVRRAVLLPLVYLISLLLFPVCALSLFSSTCTSFIVKERKEEAYLVEPSVTIYIRTYWVPWEFARQIVAQPACIK